MSKVNFYDETINSLKEWGYRVSDISWIGTEDNTYDISQFLKKAKTIDYDNGDEKTLPYGENTIKLDLRIVLNDGNFIYRTMNGDYSYEYWELFEFPTKPNNHVTNPDDIEIVEKWE